MKYYAFNDLDGLHIYSEEEIIIEYFPYWKQKMIDVGKRHLISLNACIEDWCVLHWAWEV